jgi:hypothetical protein
LYGPIPHISMNDSQDLACDIAQASDSTIYSPVLGLLERPTTSTSERILRAINWFNASNGRSADEHAALVQLSIAFEALLGLPEGYKADRFKDSIALLLGRTTRLDEWASQFYDSRSEVVHEGRARNLRFMIGKGDKNQDPPMLRPLLSFGHQVFQLCVATLLVGAELAIRFRLEEKLVTNQERFVQICTILSDVTRKPQEKLANTSQMINAIERHRYVPETALKLDTLLGATRLAAQVLIDYGEGIDSATKDGLEKIANAQKSADRYEILTALRYFNELVPSVIPSGDPAKTCGLSVIDLVWRFTNLHYYWVKQARDAVLPGGGSKP